MTDLGELGFVPHKLVVHLDKSDGDFNATIRTSDNSAFVTGTVITLKFFTTPTATLWNATVMDWTDPATSTVYTRAAAVWSVDKAVVAVLVPGTKLMAHVVYSDPSGADLVWFSGQVKWHD